MSEAMTPRVTDDLKPGQCPECLTERADVLPSRKDCQTCLKARMDALEEAQLRALAGVKHG